MKQYACASTIYVSAKTGNDSYSGLSPVCDGMNNGPVATLANAFSMVGQFRKDGISHPYTIKLMDGLYELAETIRVAPREDARYSELSPSFVTVEPYADETVTLLGGTVISGWKKDSFRGISCLSAEVAGVKEGKRDFSDLYVNGRRADYTRYPAEGFLEPEDVENHSAVLTSPSSWFIAKEGDLPQGNGMQHAFISFGHYWIDEHTAVAGYDRETRKVTLAAATRFTIAPEAGPAAKMEYYVENLADTFGNPGEWYLSHEEGKVYYIPREVNETAETLTAYAPTVSRIVDICGTAEDPVDSVAFRRIRFACTESRYESISYPKSHQSEKAGGSGFYDYAEGAKYASDLQSCSDMHGAIQLFYAQNCVFEDCEVTCVGNHAIVLGDGTTGTRIDSCHLHRLGGGGVRISQSYPAFNPVCEVKNNTVTNCLIEDGGQRYFAACGVLIMHASYNEISHNTIRDFFYSGISCGWVWGYHDSVCHHNRLLYNHIYRIGKGRLSDMGGIYTLGPQKGTVVRGNVIHDVKSKVYGGWGIYTDEGSSYMTFEDNICYRCSCEGFHQHYGRQNVLRNNIFALCGTGCLIMGRREARLGIIAENNIFLTDGHAIYKNPTPAMLSSDRNLLWDLGGACTLYQSKEGTCSVEEGMQKCGFDAHSLVADPLFADPENGDFTLSPSSPALLLGFRPIDASLAGHREK